MVYSTHLPTTSQILKLINKEIFGYLWLSKLNPIKRDVVYQSKLKGGLEIYNVFYKCQSIFTSTFLKHFLYSEENESMIKFYCALRVNPIFNIRDLPNNVSYNCPQFLDQVISTIRNATHIKTFPNIRQIDRYNANIFDLNIYRYEEKKVKQLSLQKSGFK